jgi:lipoyl(octanoyl) transferase
MHRPLTASEPAIETFLLGQIDFDTALALQHRLVFESGGRADGQIALLLCEHAPLVTIGRLGSRAHVRLPPRELASRRLDVRWVNRGGGALVHGPGQLAVYPILPLQWHHFTVGQYLARLQRGIVATLAELGIAGTTREGSHGVWGRSGQLVFFGAAVKSWTTYLGAYINVDPQMRDLRAIQTDPQADTPASSLAAERRQKINMASVRATLIPQLAAALGCERYHLYTGHPLVAEMKRNESKRVAVSYER